MTATEQPTQDIVEALGVPVIVLDSRAAIRDMNGAAEEFFGRSRAQLQGRELVALFVPNATLARMMMRAAKGGGSTAELSLFPLAGIPGDSLNVLASLSLLEGDAGMVLALFPLETSRQLEQNAQQKHVGRSLGAMAMMLAHEVKNPLSGMRGAAQLLQQSVGDGDRELAQLIIDECDRVARLVDRVEDLGDDELPESGPVNIHTVLDHVALLAKGGCAAHCRFEMRYDPSLPPVAGNFDQLVQLFLNLIKNAAEATPVSGGTLVLSTAWQPQPRTATPPVQVQVIDSGAGIPDDLRSTLFSLPLSRKPGGQGLGLPIAARIVARHGGRISFSSEPGRTVFTVALPPHAAGKARP